MPPASRPVVAIDGTALINQPVTGIQRVILALVPRLASACFTRGHNVALVDSRDAVPRCLRLWDRPISVEELRTDLAAVAHDDFVLRNRHLRRLARMLGGPSWYLAKKARLGLGLRHRLRSLLIRRRPPLQRAEFYVSFSAGILPCRVPRGLSAERVLLVLHDLIPLHYPAYQRPEVTRAFGVNVLDLAQGPDGPRGRFLTASSHVACEIRDLFWGLCRSQVNVGLVAWGYDRETFFPDPDPDFRRKLGVPSDALLVLAVSTQDPRKRFADVEKAIRLLSKRLPVHGVFLGHGPARRQENVHYLGHVGDEMLRRAYSSCDVFVNWSAAEGFGLPVIEALACGARVVVPPDNPTLREVGGKEVVVANQASPAGLMDALAMAARERGRPRIPPELHRFDWDDCCRRIEEQLWSVPIGNRRAA